MAGALSVSSLGQIYVGEFQHEKKFTIKPYLDEYHVCKRINNNKKEIIGAFKNEWLARFFLNMLNKYEL